MGRGGIRAALRASQGRSRASDLCLSVPLWSLPCACSLDPGPPTARGAGTAYALVLVPVCPSSPHPSTDRARQPFLGRAGPQGAGLSSPTGEVLGTVFVSEEPQEQEPEVADTWPLWGLKGSGLACRGQWSPCRVSQSAVKTKDSSPDNVIIPYVICYREINASSQKDRAGRALGEQIWKPWGAEGDGPLPPTSPNSQGESSVWPAAASPGEATPVATPQLRALPSSGCVSARVRNWAACLSRNTEKHQKK